MINVLAIGLNYMSARGMDRRGKYKDTNEIMLAKHLSSITRIIYSPRALNLKSVKYASNVDIFFTSSITKSLFIFDAIRTAKSISRKLSFDVITAEDPFLGGLTALLLKYILRVPLNLQLDHDRINNQFWIKENRINFFKNIFARYIIKHADTVRVMSTGVARRLASFGISENKIWVVPPYVDMTRFGNNSGSFKTNLFGNEFNKIVLFVGRLSREKDLPTLLKAFQKVVQTHRSSLLAIVGDGPEKENLQRLSVDLSISKNVFFAGAIDYDLVPQFFASCDIFVLTSLHEGRANVIIEAALSNKPIISTRVSGADDCIIDGKTGFIIDQYDHINLSDKIMFLLDNPDTAKSFGESGCLFIKQKDNEINCRNLLIDCWQATATQYSH